MSTKDFSADSLRNSSQSNIESKWASLRKTQNPYAYYSVFDVQEDGQPPVVAGPVATVARRLQGECLSKKDFQAGCHRIFRQYVPFAEGRRLRPQYRDFIARNECRSAEQRFRLLEALRKYDISASGNLKPHFNREQELLTTAKLRQIEETALRSDASN